MRRFLTKKVALIGVATAFVLGGGGVAFAYFTSTGSGTGSSAVGSPTTWGVSSATSGGPMYPGVGVNAYQGNIVGPGVETIQVTVTNNGKGDQEVTGFTIEIANPDGSTWTSSTSAHPLEAACTNADFVMGRYSDMNSGIYSFGVNLGTPVKLAPGASYNFPYSIVSLAMADTGVPQDNCQGLTVPLYITSP